MTEFMFAMAAMVGSMGPNAAATGAKRSVDLRDSAGGRRVQQHLADNGRTIHLDRLAYAANTRTITMRIRLGGHGADAGRFVTLSWDAAATGFAIDMGNGLVLDGRRLQAMLQDELAELYRPELLWDGAGRGTPATFA